MADAHGYFGEIEYGVYKAFTPMMPPSMQFYCALRGVAAPDFLSGFSYCELGCGHGFGVMMAAALYPEGRFVGVDFSAPQIEKARRMAATAGVDNLDLVETDFGSFADGDAESFDVIALHGVWSWVAPEVQADILRVIDRKLKPHGLVYLSANMMPGWAHVAPAQRLATTLWERRKADGLEAALAEFKTVFGLSEHMQGRVPGLKEKIERALTHPGYFTGEYLSSAWKPLYFTELAEQLGRAGLSFVAASTPLGVFDAMYLTRAQRQYLAGMEDPVYREFLRDIFLSVSFRQDYWSREPRGLSAGEQYRAMESCSLSLVKLEGRFPTTEEMAEREIDGELFQACMKRLARGPALLGELFALAADRPNALAAVLRVILSLLNSGAIALGLGDGENAVVRERARRFNEMALATPGLPAELQLASPVLRVAVPLNAATLDLLKRLLAGEPAPKDAQQKRQTLQLLSLLGIVGSGDVPEKRRKPAAA